MIVVPDAGPLIYLGGAGQLVVLPALYADVVVPRIVFDEVVVAGAGLPGSAECPGSRAERRPVCKHTSDCACVRPMSGGVAERGANGTLDVGLEQENETP